MSKPDYNAWITDAKGKYRVSRGFPVTERTVDGITTQNVALADDDENPFWDPDVIQGWMDEITNVFGNKQTAVSTAITTIEGWMDNMLAAIGLPSNMSGMHNGAGSSIDGTEDIQ
jgi:hypothetical protein